MSIEVKVPQLPESVTDATIVAWHKRAGDSVRRDENLVDLETDKVVLEVPAPSDGIIKELKFNDGDIVTGGQVLALLEPGTVAAVTSDAQDAPTESSRIVAEPSTEAPAERLGPAARRLVEEHDLDASAIVGSGRAGRVTKADVLDYLETHVATAAESEEDAPITMRPSGGGSRAEHRVAMTRLRSRIAERLVEAQQTAAMLTTFNEIDLTEVMGLRARYRDEFQERHNVKLGFMSFFVKAVVDGLKQFPAINAQIQGSDIVYHNYFDIGIAVGGGKGLVVPVIRNAERLSFAEIELTISEYAARASENRISVDELKGGTFTISNGGIYGSMLSTPIVNPPQSGILGMHAIQERPVAVNGEVVIRPMMYLALTYDHRVVDGREAVTFLVRVKECIENPTRMLIEV